MLATGAAPAPDAIASVDAKAGAPGPAGVDPRVVKLIGEAWRHCKPIATLGSDAKKTLAACGVDAKAPGVFTGRAVADDLREALAMHRVWRRFAARAS